MSWKKHTKKLDDIKKENIKTDKEIEERFSEIIGELGGKEDAVALESLKEYLMLSPEDADALKELGYMASGYGGYTVKYVVHRKENEEYVFFPKVEEIKEEPPEKV